MATKNKNPFGKLETPIESKCVECNKIYLRRFKDQIRCSECGKRKRDGLSIRYKFPDPKTLEIITIDLTPKQYRLAQLLVNPIIEEEDISKELKYTKEYIDKFKREKKVKAFLTYLMHEHFASVFKATDLILMELVKDAYKHVRDSKKDPADIVYMVWDRFFKYMPNEDLQNKLKKAGEGWDVTVLRETVKRIQERKKIEENAESEKPD